MQKIVKYILRNLLNVTIILLLMVYLIITTPNIKTAVGVLCALYIFIGSMFMSALITQAILYEKVPAKIVINVYKLPIALFFVTCLILYFIKGWMVLSAFLTGALGFVIFFAIVFLIKRKFRK